MGVLRARVGGVWVDIGTSTLAPNRNLLDNSQHAVKQHLDLPSYLPASARVSDRWTAQQSGFNNYLYYLHQALTGTVPAGRPRPANIMFFNMESTKAAGSVAAGDFILQAQSIEGRFLQHLNWGTVDAQPVTFSCDVFSTVASTYVVELIRTETGIRSISALMSVPAGVSTQIITFPGDTTTLITNDNTSRLTLNVWLTAGSTYTSGTLLTGWAASVNANRAKGISNNFQAGINTFWITNVQLEVGGAATPYEVRAYDQELFKAMRYYRQTPLSPNGEGCVFGYGTAGSIVGTTVNFPVVMRATPTVTIAGTWVQTNCTMNYAINGPQNFIPYGTPTATGMIQIYGNNSGYWIFNAEI